MTRGRFELKTVGDARLDVAAPPDNTRRLTHDLNNLLMVVAGYTDILMAENPDTPFVGDLAEIRRAAREAVDIVAILAQGSNPRAAA